MNERIRELADQAWKCAEHPIIPRDFDMGIFEKKFAELLIQECCEVLREEVEVALSAVGDVAYPERLVRKHFGVEE